MASHPTPRCRTVPKEIRCRWKRQQEQTKGVGPVYGCLDCGSWTANLPLYKDSICHLKDRRKSRSARRQDDRR